MKTCDWCADILVSLWSGPLVLASRFVRRYHGEANGEPLEKTCTALYGLVSPHSCFNDQD